MATLKAVLPHDGQGPGLAPEGHIVDSSEACAGPNDRSIRKQTHDALQLCC